MDKHKGEHNSIQTIIKFLVFLITLALQIVILLLVYKGTNNLFIYSEVIFNILKVFSIIYIIHKPINPSYKLTWIVLIAVLPVLGIVMFLLFGNVGIPKMLKKTFIKNKELSQKFLNYKKEDYMILKEMDIYKYKQACFLTNVSDYPLYRSNNIEYLDIGEKYLEKLLIDLKKAEKYIFLEYFIIAKSSMWEQIYSILEEKSKEGVKIYILTDQIGSNRRTPDCFKENFNNPNIYTKMFNPIFPFLSIHINYRDHRKIAVIDGRIAYTGGINIGDEYINKTSTLGHWKDTGVRITGKSVTNFVIMFLRMWNIENKNKILNYSDFVLEEPNYPNDDNGFILPFCDGPHNHNNPSENTYINMINSAKRSVYITTPYLILDNETLISLTNAALAGIDVRIIIPHIPDKKIVFTLSRSYYEKLLKAGVKIYEYEKGFIHSKMCVVDSSVAVIGTINFDFRSLYLNYECGVWLYNTGTEKKIQEDFLLTQENSIQIKYENWKKRSFLKKIFEAILISIAPLL